MFFVLNSKKTLKIKSATRRNFVLFRNSVLSLDAISKIITRVEEKFLDLYNVLNQLMHSNQKETEQKERNQIGYKKN